MRLWLHWESITINHLPMKFCPPKRWGWFVIARVFVADNGGCCIKFQYVPIVDVVDWLAPNLCCFMLFPNVPPLVLLIPHYHPIISCPILCPELCHVSYNYSFVGHVGSPSQVISWWYRQTTTCLTMEHHILVGGFNPSEKYESQLGWLFHIILNLWKNHPVMFQSTNQYRWFTYIYLLKVVIFHLIMTGWRPPYVSIVFFPRCHQVAIGVQRPNLWELLNFTLRVPPSWRRGVKKAQRNLHAL